nr:uncharacterized protein LOC108073394 [Drosophila kikkawai]
MSHSWPELSENFVCRNSVYQLVLNSRRSKFCGVNSLNKRYTNMPCESCGKACKCTPQKCSEGCKCPSPDKCDCNAPKKSAAASGGKERSSAGADGQGGKCCGGKK